MYLSIHKSVARGTHKSGAVLTEGGFNISGLCERVNEAHLTVQQWTGLHKVIDHLLPADLTISDRETETERKREQKKRVPD